MKKEPKLGKGGHAGRKAHEPHSLTHKGAHKKDGAFMTSPMKKNLGK